MKIAIIGTGFAGLCMGIKLKEAGYDDFVIYEKAGEVGGTWRDNTYPGCACDVKSHLYSFSFDLNPNWSRTFSPRQEIWEYLDRCTDKYGLRPHIRFNTCVTDAEFNEEEGLWHIRTADGQEDRVDIFVTASGGLTIPAYPGIPGLKDFNGPIFHSAEWDHSCGLKGKKVAVIGTGASAIQIVPQIAPMAEQLYLFQRTPAWVMPKPDRPFRPVEMKLFRNFPWLMKLYRGWIYWTSELRVPAFTSSPKILKLIELIGKWHLRKHIKDPELRKKLTPQYALGCKRVLVANDYYPTFNRQNVHLVTEGIDRITDNSIVTKEAACPVDVIVLATGFQATEYLSNVNIKGLNGRTLGETWEQNPEAYLGTTVSGFPNMFMFTGPNTGLGHTSMVVMMEGQVSYIMDAIQMMNEKKLKSVDVKHEAQRNFNEKLQDKMQGTVWQTGGCRSWYQDETGKNVTLWPWSTVYFRKRTRKFDAENYVTVERKNVPPGHSIEHAVSNPQRTAS